MTGTHRRSVALFVIVCVAVWLVPTGIAVAMWSASTLVERSAVSTDAPDLIEVGERVDAEVKDAVVDVYFGEARTVMSETTGTVTQILTSVGSTLTNGAPVVAIDNSVIRAYTHDFPLYRTLARGDRGADVEALEIFLRDCGFLNVAAIDDVYGSQVDKAVRAFQEANGYSVDGAFAPGYVAFVGSSFTVASIDVVPGAKVALGDEIMVGAAPVTKIEIKDPDLNPLPPFSGAPLNLDLAETTVSVDGTSLEGAAAEDVATAVSTSGMKGTALDEGQLMRYAGARIALAEPSAWGTVPSSAVYVSDGGQRCALSADGTVVPLVKFRQSTGQPGIALVQPDLVGVQIVYNVTEAAPGSFDAC